MLLAAGLLPVLAPHPAMPGAAAVTAPRPSGDIILSAIIERPASVPPIAARPAQTMVVTFGETVESLATVHRSDASAIRWANGLAGGAQPAPGTALLLPPGPGALVQVLPSERPSHFAVRLGLDPRVLLDYNALAKDTPRTAGSYLQVPLAAAPPRGWPEPPRRPLCRCRLCLHGSAPVPSDQCTGAFSAALRL